MQRANGVDMSQSKRKDFAYPKSNITINDFLIFRFCGGSGGGECPAELGTTHFIYPIRVPKHLVYNRSLLLRNPEFLGVEIFGNAGAVGLCNPASDGVRQPWWLAFSDDGSLSDIEVMQRGIKLTAAPPYDIEVDASRLPQPVLRGGGANPNWENRIYVHIVWESASYVTFSAYLYNQDERVLEMVKHNYDIKI